MTEPPCCYACPCARPAIELLLSLHSLKHCSVHSWRSLDGQVGYTQGWAKQPSYSDVCSGKTGHTEAVQASYSHTHTHTHTTT